MGERIGKTGVIRFLTTLVAVAVVVSVATLGGTISVAGATGQSSAGETLAGHREADGASQPIDATSGGSIPADRQSRAMNETGRIYPTTGISQEVSALRNRTDVPASTEAYILLADDDHYVIFTEQTVNFGELVTVEGTLTDTTVTSDNISFRVVREATFVTRELTTTVEGSPDVSALRGATVSPGGSAVIEASVVRSDVAFVGVPSNWTIEGSYPEITTCGALSVGDCEFVFEVPLDSEAVGSTLAATVVTYLERIVPFPLDSTLETLGVFDAVESALTDIFASVLSGVFDRVGVRELTAVVWISPPGGTTSTSFSVPVTVDSDETRDRVPIPVLAGDFEPATTSPSDVAYASVTLPGGNDRPTADAGGPYSVSAGGSVSLDSSGSSDTDGSVETTAWRLVGGPGSVEGATYRAPDSVEGETTATVELTVTDDDGGTDTDTATVTVAPSATGTDATRSIESTMVPAGESTTVTVEVTADSAADVSVTETFDPAFADVVVDDAAPFPSVQSTRDDGTGMVAIWRGEDSVSVTYEVTVPEDAADGADFTISSATTVDGSSISVSGPDTITVGESVVARYRNEAGRVDTAGLTDAVSDWSSGDLTTAELNRVVEAWSRGSRES